MLKAGLNLNRSLLILIKQSRKDGEKKIYNQILQDIESGLTLSESLAKKEGFEQLFNSVIAAGESSGTLVEVLKKLEEYYKSKRELRKEIKKASFYPLTVITTVFIAALFIFHFVLPVFIDLFNDFDGKLPLISRIFINFTVFIDNYIFLILIFIIILIITILFLLKNDKAAAFKNKFMTKFFFKIPILKTLYQDLILTQIAIYLSLFLKSGLSLISALEFIADIIKNSSYKNFIQDTTLNISKGASLADCFSDSDLIPDLFYYLLVTGEESANLEYMLERAGDYYYQKLKEEIAKMLQYLEPLLISLTAIFVALLAAAVIMPMFQLYLII